MSLSLVASWSRLGRVLACLGRVLAASWRLGRVLSRVLSRVLVASWSQNLGLGRVVSFHYSTIVVSDEVLPTLLA